MTDVIQPLSARRARRSFESRPVPDDLQESLWKAVALAPSHGNNQPVRVLVAAREPARKALFQALSPGNQTWAGAAPLLFAIAAIPAHDHVAEDRDGTQRELWAYHAGIATGNLMAQATALGLIAHPMAGFDEPAVRAVFGAPDPVRILAVVAAGYEGPISNLVPELQQRESAPQRRLPLDHLVAVDHWEERHGVSMREWRDREERR
jgi:nitroreductase